MERYYWFRSVNGPKEQNGLALKVTQDSLVDLTNMLNFERKGTKTYIADTNVNMWGEPCGEQDPIKFYVEENSRLRIRQQSLNQVYLTEISYSEAERIRERIAATRSQQTQGVRSLTPNSPDAQYYL